MNIANTKNSYGIISILIHWIMAVLIVGLFILGIYMVDLDYYSKWYNAAPWWHKSFGLLVSALLLFRIVWVINTIRPAPLDSYKSWEIKVARITHYSFYILLFVICISGYLISTAKGAAIEFFSLIDVPAIISFSKQQADIAGEIHEIAAYIMAFLFLLHVCATFKHHFIDKDMTLLRILKPVKPEGDE
ncbi:MAG: cytochrome b [Proteobacteria bacterium]|nr:cytochrome b [Pseudomonadota bacterium]NOG60375.1 cytochrome b [Pseudomonadota bacterium]